MSELQQFGLVVHPEREIGSTLATIEEWAGAHGIRIGQVPVDGMSRKVAEPVDAASCDLIVAVGGDGTALAALHAGADASRPVLGIACGSIGALTSVHADKVDWALDEVADRKYELRSLPALAIDGRDRLALNDIAIVRKGGGQVAVAVSVDGELYARLAGDGVIVSTPMGSSAYTMAAGGPLLTTHCESFVVTPLAAHGGSIPPLVVGGGSSLRLEIDPGHGGMRLEMDGQERGTPDEIVEIARRTGYAQIVSLAGEEKLLAGLRRRNLVLDSPRATLRERRDGKL